MATGFIPACVGGGESLAAGSSGGGPQPVKANPALPGNQGGNLVGGTLVLPMGSAPPKLVVGSGPATQTGNGQY